ncbi:hypothetical protein HY417_02370 [Candidatus Kaiserbacteria bacterium]|nr:hypothetical protein [Candidatus Kaiserbacteria bacterium]
MNNLHRLVAYLRGQESRSMKFAGALLLGILFLFSIGFALSFVPPPTERLLVSRTGYTLRYPADWIVEGVRRDSSYESEFIREPGGRATVSISSHSEPRLRQETGRAAIINEIELAFTQDESYKLDFLDWISADLGAEFNGYTASGSFENGGAFVFREIGIFDPSGEKLTFRSEVRSRYAGELVPVVDSVLLSVRPDARERTSNGPGKVALITAEEAKALIEQLPYFALDREAAFERGEKHKLEVEDGGTLWHVGLYVEGEGVRFPIQRWRVDKATGAISKVLP